VYHTLSVPFVGKIILYFIGDILAYILSYLRQFYIYTYHRRTIVTSYNKKIN